MPDLEPASALASLTLRFLGKEREFRLYNDSLLYREYQCVLPGGCVYLTEWKGQLGAGAFAARFANKPGSGPDEQSALSALERALVPLADDLSCLIESDRASVREPLETQLDALRRRLHEQADVIAERDRRIGELVKQCDLIAEGARLADERIIEVCQERNRLKDQVAEFEVQLASAREEAHGR